LYLKKGHHFCGFFFEKHFLPDFDKPNLTREHLSHFSVMNCASHDLINRAVAATVSFSEMGQKIWFNFRPLQWWSEVWLA